MALDVGPMTLEQALNQPQASQVVVAHEHVKQLGRAYGVRMGAAARAQEIEAELKGKAAHLDATLTFASLLIDDAKTRVPGAASVAWIVPPVLIEATDEVTSIDGGQQLRLTAATYRIERAPRYVTAIPTWRDHVLPVLNTLQTQSRDAGYSPKAGAETEAWRVGVKDGWPTGRQMADLSFKAALDKAVRDFEGMTLYHTLHTQGVVTSPIEVLTTKAAERAEGNALVVGQRTYSIQATSVWNPVPETWRGYAEGNRAKR